MKGSSHFPLLVEAKGYWKGVNRHLSYYFTFIVFLPKNKCDTMKTTCFINSKFVNLSEG